MSPILEPLGSSGLDRSAKKTKKSGDEGGGGGGGGGGGVGKYCKNIAL